MWTKLHAKNNFNERIEWLQYVENVEKKNWNT